MTRFSNGNNICTPSAVEPGEQFGIRRSAITFWALVVLFWVRFFLPFLTRGALRSISSRNSRSSELKARAGGRLPGLPESRQAGGAVETYTRAGRRVREGQFAETVGDYCHRIEGSAETVGSLDLINGTKLVVHNKFKTGAGETRRIQDGTPVGLHA